ncbi:MAG: hypothetical protein QJR12_09900 [Mycobacterium sp.]|uniref:hypothetical protein n=1 Tax=Mycobacterium sp. TaxID=1785 RepID=UPI00262550B3|nr:hypothetical protein [Mycobacterium sp.]MDI3314560.1 hypothetical protein [Mycobacterium sp.]
MIPTQSAVRAYDVSYLTEHAAHWRELAERRRNVAGAIQAQADSLDWQGQADEAMRAAMARHLRTAEEEAGLLDAAAGTAENGASVLHQQQQSVLSAVEQARQSGFVVGEDWSATDAMYPPGSTAWYARLPTAQAITAELRAQAGAFAAQEYQTATDIVTSAGDLGGEGAVRGHIQAVDHHFKTDGPAPQPSLPPNPIGQLEQAITAPPAPPSVAPPLMPASPPPRPPQMGPAPPPVSGPDAPPEANPTIGGFLGTAVPGCLAGAGDGGLLTSLFPPLEVLGVPGGCIAGGIVAGGGYLGGIWVDNMLNGNG